MNLIDNLIVSPYYLYRKYKGTANESFYFDIRNEDQFRWLENLQYRFGLSLWCGFQRDIAVQYLILGNKLVFYSNLAEIMFI